MRVSIIIMPLYNGPSEIVFTLRGPHILIHDTLPQKVP